MKKTPAPSPNFNDRKVGIDMIVLHYTGMQSGAEALARMRDAQAEVSAHYMVEEDGEIFQLVADDKRAWHAGVGTWKGEGDINSRSIGIEIVNPGHEFGYRPFPEKQIEAVIALIRDIKTRHAIAPELVLAHSDIAPRRKEDPGELFPWARLADEGLALAPFTGDVSAADEITYQDALAMLSEIGYDAPPGDHMAGLIAFQRRFCPAALAQGFDPLTKAALKAVSRNT